MNKLSFFLHKNEGLLLVYLGNESGLNYSVLHLNSRRREMIKTSLLTACVILITHLSFLSFFEIDMPTSTQPDGSEMAAKIVSLFSITLLSVLFGIKTYNVQYKFLTYSRWMVLALYLCSWAFTTISTLLVTTNNSMCCFLL